MTRACAAGALLMLAVTVRPALTQDQYPLTADSERQPGVPSGRVTKHAWTSAVFPGTQRDYWIYVPAQYRPETPAAVMVFQDGGRFVAEDGRWRVPIVFDNLIQRGEMPVTVGVFVDPGVAPALRPEQQPRFNRSFEYDALGDRYARFLLDELLPEVGKSVNLTSDPGLRAIGGSSSGGICAFTAAWNRPDAFRRVLSFIGSYTGLRGGDSYPTLIRKTEPRPIRVFLQDGSHDLDIYSGNWWFGNQAMASALAYAGYDVRFVVGDGGHDSNQGSAILPDALRWLWREWKEPITPSKGRTGAERHYVTEILDPAAGWEPAGRLQGPAGDLAVDAQGEVYVADPAGARILRIEQASGRMQTFRERTEGVRGIAFGADGRLYAGQPSKNRIVAWTTDGKESVIAGGLEVDHLVIGANGGIWATDAGHRRVWYVDPRGGTRVAQEGMVTPTSLAISGDQALLAVGDRAGRWVWSFPLAADGSLRHGEAFYRLETGEAPGSDTGGMTVDSEGYLYVATPRGIQVFDQPGRVTAIIDTPAPFPASGIAFGGRDLDRLYLASGDQLFRRRLRRKGVFPGLVIKLPTPRL